MSDRKLISIVIPVFNEGEVITQCYETLAPILDRLNTYDFEIVFTDNHSTDNTFLLLSALAQKDSRVRVYRFSRNFGYQRSILTGYHKARGAAAIQLDCDLQDPPEIIEDFLKKWEEGYSVVYGVRRSRQEGWLINKMRQIFYALIDKISDINIPKDAGDFRLIDRKVLDILQNFSHVMPYIRGTIAQVGFDQIGIPYDRAPRAGGTSKFSFFGYCAIALDGIVSQSILPLRLAIFFGIAAAVLALAGIIFALFGHILFGSGWPQGYASLVTILLFSLAFQSLFLGILGEYVARIYKSSMDEPLTIIERELPPPTIKR